MEKEFEESFERIYNEVCNSCEQNLNQAKKKKNLFILGVATVLLIINLIIYVNPESKYMVSLSLSISVCIILFFIIVGNGNYRKIYKKLVIEGLVKGYNNKFYYTANEGITRMEYSISNFDKGFDEYHSEDRIYGRLEDGANFQMAEVVTHEVHRTQDENGNVSESRVQLFRGVFGIVRLEKNISDNIYIASDYKLRKYSKKRVEVDSAEFEKYYDCITQDKITAMRIFTAELIEKYIEIVRDNKNAFELKIEDNMIYFRYKTNQLFEPPTFSTGLNKELLKRYYKVMFYPLEIMKSTVENINLVVE